MAARKNYSGGTNRSTGRNTSKRATTLRQVKQEQARLGPRGSDKSLMGRLKQNKVDKMAQAANYKPTPKKRTR